MAKHRKNRQQLSQPNPITRAEAYRRFYELDQQRQRLVSRMREASPTFYSPLAGEGWSWQEQPDIPLVELWAEVHWTQEAADRIRADEYRYISPEFDLDYQDPGSGDRIGAALLAIGLVTRPFLKGMAKVEDPDAENICHVQVFATGEWHHPFYGRITVEERHLQEMIDNAATVGNTMHPDSEHEDTELCVDYNHMSLWGGPEQSKAAGWVRGNGVYLVHPGEEEDEEEMEDEEMDQEMKKKKGMKKREMTSPALVHPKNPPSSKGAITMKEDRIRQLLKLSADTPITDQHRDQALDALDAELAARPEVPALQTPAGSVALSQAEVETLRAQAAQGEAAARALRERDARDAVREAHAAHKLTAVQAALPTKEAPEGGWAYQYALKDPEGFRAFIAGATVVVPVGRDGSPSTPPEGGDGEKVKAFLAEQQGKGVALGEAQVAAIRQFGQAAFDEYRKSLRPAA